jgi:hypothetical protein
LFDVYEKYHSQDLFLHLNYCEYATFGQWYKYLIAKISNSN